MKLWNRMLRELNGEVDREVEVMKRELSRGIAEFRRLLWER